MTESLVTLAEQQRLPQFQYMDATTLAWIAAQQVVNLQLTQYTFSRPSALLSLPLEDDWFLERKIIASIHGKRHAHRVAYFCQHLAKIYGANDRCVRRVILAGLLHDIRRLDDKGDPAHGKRAATWLQAASALGAGWNLTIDEDDIQAMSVAIRLHELPYASFSAQQTQLYETYKREVDILKTADALDRYRLPKLTWWIRDEHLRLLPPAWLKRMAYGLVLKSEAFYLETKDNDSVLHILERAKNAHA